MRSWKCPTRYRLLKNRYSALIAGSSPLERMLRGMGIDTILVVGTETNVCCESTARDAMMPTDGVALAMSSAGPSDRTARNLSEQQGVDATRVWGNGLLPHQARPVLCP
jgi:hypothetical protein